MAAHHQFCTVLAIICRIYDVPFEMRAEKMFKRNETYLHESMQMNAVSIGITLYFTIHKLNAIFFVHLSSQAMISSNSNSMPAMQRRFSCFEY